MNFPDFDKFYSADYSMVVRATQVSAQMFPYSAMLVGLFKSHTDQLNYFMSQYPSSENPEIDNPEEPERTILEVISQPPTNEAKAVVRLYLAYDPNQAFFHPYRALLEFHPHLSIDGLKKGEDPRGVFLVDQDVSLNIGKNNEGQEVVDPIFPDSFDYQYILKEPSLALEFDSILSTQIWALRVQADALQRIRNKRIDLGR